MGAGLTLRFSGRKARELREKAGLTITELAKRCAQRGHEVHHSAISKAEIGTNGPSPALLKAIVDVLGCDVDDLLDDCPPAVES